MSAVDAVSWTLFRRLSATFLHMVPLAAGSTSWYADAVSIRRYFEELNAVVVILEDAVADLHTHYVSRCRSICVLLREARSLSCMALRASRFCSQNAARG
jgi:hypothetical protein